jgi:hypothetical protein
MNAPHFFVCDKCQAGFREDARPAFELIGKVKPDTNECACGGTFVEMSADDAIGQGGALDTALSRRSGNKPN